MFQKEIIYMGLYKDGNRLGNAGFLRVEKRDQEGSLSLQVKNVPRSVSGRFPVRYYSGTTWKEVDGITLQDGNGQWEKQEAESLVQIRLQIVLPGGYLVEGASRTVENQSNVPKMMAKPSAEGDMLEGEDALVQKQKADESNDKIKQETVENSNEIKQAAIEDSVRTKPAKKIEYIAVQKQNVQKPVEDIARTEQVMQAESPLMADKLVVTGLKEDKWEQILDTYDKIHPYGDERVYVKLEPKDFLILSSKYQHLVNNSFLLHGFYNYRHVILGKEGEYYLGVPGVFYEREKMVALMFGFEAFECESGDPKAGTFGYYLRKVEL
ncbi:MAG: hypothetical protein K2N00_04285 [Lachnospiraceae bacterium]|nr:hypothetical protein [Lachnospiraceae bacterium]